MPLIGCPECGREVSSSALTCPECAYPLMSETPSVPPRAVSGTPKYEWVKTTVSMVGRVFFGVMLATLGWDVDESVAAVIGGVTIAASSIPTWYRAKLDRLRSGQGATGLENRVSDQMVELEHRYRDQLDRLERAHSEQFADLEERMEFTERLVTRDRDKIGPG